MEREVQKYKLISFGLLASTLILEFFLALNLKGLLWIEGEKLHFFQYVWLYFIMIMNRLCA